MVSDNTVQTWNAHTGELITELNGPTAVENIAFSLSTLQVASRHRDDHSVVLWNVETGEAKVLLNGHSDLVITARFSFYGTLVATYARDGTLRAWKTNTGEQTFFTNNVDHSEAEPRFAFTSDNTTLVLLENGDRPRYSIYDVNAGTCTARIAPDGGTSLESEVALLCKSGDCTKLLVSAGGLQMFDIASEQTLCPLEDSTDSQVFYFYTPYEYIRYCCWRQ